MSTVLRYSRLIAVATSLLVALPALAEEGVRGNLVDVHWLEKHLNSPDLIILDASPPSYAKQHIPGALSVDIYDLFAYGFGDKSAAHAEQLFQSLGISPGKKIVIYDEGADNVATRLFFDLDYHGFPARDLFILDGGIFKWQQEHLPVSKDPTPAPAKGSFTVANLNDDVRVGLPEFLKASGDPAHYALVEGLDPQWHYGEIGPFERAGHPPNGILASGADFFNPDKTFKSPEEVRKMLTYLGIRPEQQLYTYCGGGVAATIPFFAAKFSADYPQVKVFPESELGWLSDQRELPYWTYDAPFLMRTTAWLQFWSGRMIRMYLGAPVSIVDVRPAEAFNQGHIPFALNLPAALFRSTATDPTKLAQTLGAAGVQASDEAVIVSGAGITKDSALAFVMFEKLGQKKVSVFMDPLDKWTQPGQALTKDPTAVGPKKTPHDPTIVPTSYATALRDGVLITDPKATHGAYPKVFIASGSSVPSKAQDGKIVHVAYTDLLNPDGTPKPSKDIWKILDKAGVPRYAELICIFDDPGEAAANYLTLKLMGYPDVKVLLM
ncbi:MAG: hypothetical protein NVS9B15_16040 [Acidobacteriaceae bacterium]